MIRKDRFVFCFVQFGPNLARRGTRDSLADRLPGSTQESSFRSTTKVHPSSFEEEADR